MKTFKELRKELEEHPNLKARILAKINPLDKLKDKLDDLKTRYTPGEIKDRVVGKLKDKIDAMNPFSAIHAVGNKEIDKKVRKLRDKKKVLKNKSNRIRDKIKTLKAKKTPKKKT